MSTEPGRAQRRATWPVRRYALGQEPSQNLCATTTAEERLEMMWPLALEAWTLTGLALPGYTRGEAPVRCLPLKAVAQG